MGRKIRILVYSMILTFLFGSIVVHAAADGGAKITCNDHKTNCINHTVNIGDDGFKLEMINLKEGEKPRWISYNVNVARVDQDGNVTPIRKGTTIISSGIGFPRETCKVTVVEPGIQLNKTEVTLYRSDNEITPGDTVALTAKINGAVKDAARIEWTSSNESVAKVTWDNKSRKHVVKSSDAAGTAIITAKANGKTASCKVNVIDSSISLNAETIQLSEGSSVKLLPTVVGAKKAVKWTSSDVKTATVSGGKVTGKKASSEPVTVTAEANGIKKTCVVTVVEKQISINEKNVLLFVNGVSGTSGLKGETKELKTNAKKTDNVIWTSNADSVVKVERNKKDKSKATITAVKPGKAVITAKFGDKTDTCVVEVKNIKDVIEKESVQLKTNGIDKTCMLKHTVDGRRKAVWKSSKPAVVAVKDGVLTAKKAGSATVSVTLNGYKDEVDVVVVDTKNSISIALNHYEYTLYKIKGQARAKENGNTVALKAMINGKSRNATWRSSNAKVAEVDKKGKVTAKSAGLACITAETDGLTAKCWISVKNPEIILDKTEFVIKPGEKVNLWTDASMAVTGATQTVKYTSTNKKAATVDSKGIVTGKNLGTGKKSDKTKITIYANGAEAECNVTVSACGDGNHTLGEKITVRPASCEKSGLEEQICSVCEGKVQTITPPLGHKFFEDGDIDKGWTVYKETTVNAVGLEKRVCKRDGCGAEETRIIPLKEKDDFKKDEFEKDDFENVNYEGYKLIWHDEFNGTKLDKESWNVELHDPGWVNKELQEYVDSERNIYVESGNLVIQALERKDDYGRPIYTERNRTQMKTYTSGRINTKDKHNYKYGRFEARAKVPSGNGFLPAFWMMPANENYYGQWPKCGEIDIMEVLGSNTKKAHSTLHFGDPHTQQQGTFTLSGGDFSEEFHVYACEWEPGEMRFYVDGILFYKVNDWFTQTTGFEKTAYPAPYDQPFYMILNLAVGGEWVGYPDEDAKMGDNAQLVVDYVRVYQKDAAVYEEMEEKVKVPVTEVVLRDPDEDGNYIINGDFAKKESLPNGENWKLLLAEKGKASATISNKALHITTTEEGTENHSVQIVQADLPIEKGCRYELSYDAYADVERTMVTALTAPDKGYVRYLKNTIVNLTTTNQPFTHTFDMEAESDANGRLEFNLGNQDSTAKVHISNVKLKKLDDGVQESDRLPDGNFVRNGSFDVGNEPGKIRLKYWNLDTANCSEAKISVTNDSKREMKVVVPDTVAGLEAVKVSQNVAIEGGKDNKGKDRKYILSFDAYADQAKTIKSTIAGETFTAQLTTESTTYKYEFTPAQDVKGSELQFLLGVPGTTYIDNVCVRENILIVNGDFSSGMSGFEVYVNDDAKVMDYTVDSLNEDGAFSIDIADTADEGWKIQLKQNNIKLEKDKWYKLSFDAKSTLNRKIMYALQRDGSSDGNWDPYSGEHKIDLTGEYQNFSHTFKMAKDTDPKTILSISMGAVDERVTTKHTVAIDNITLEETEAQEIPPVEDDKEMILNGDFSEGDAHWKSEINAGVGGAATVDFSQGKAVYKITSVGTEDYSVKLNHTEKLTLEKGAKYAVKFKIKSTEARTVKYSFMTSNYGWYGGDDLELAANELKSVDYEMTVGINDETKEPWPTSNDITFSISMGQIKGKDTPTSTIEIDDISVKKIGGSGEEEPIVGNLISNGNFAAGNTGWSSYFHSENGTAVAKGKDTFTGGKARYEITNAGVKDWNVQLKQEGLDMEKGASYKVDFKIGSSIDRDVKLAFMGKVTKDGKITEEWCGGDGIRLTANKLKSVSRIVTLKNIDIDGKFAFQLSMGNYEAVEGDANTITKLAPHAIEIFDVSVTKVEAGTTAADGEDVDFTIAAPGTGDEGDTGDEVNDDITSLELGDEMIKNGDFADDKTSWTESSGTFEVKDGKAVFNITDIGEQPYSVQLKQTGLTLEENASYVVQFDIESSKDRDVLLELQKNGSGWTVYGVRTFRVKANESKKVVAKIDVKQATTEDSLFFIGMGKVGATTDEAHTITIDNVSVKKVSAGTGEGGDEQDGDNLIQNGEFEKWDENWNTGFYASEGEGKVEPQGKADLTHGKARYEITNAGSEAWNVQLKQEGLAMETGATYKVNFKIGSSIDRDVTLEFQDKGFAGHGNATISLKANKLKSVSQIVTLDDKAFDGTLAFQLSMGNYEEGENDEKTTTKLVPHAIEISDISVTKVAAGATADDETETDVTIASPADNMITNGNFADGETGWSKYFHSENDTAVAEGNAKFSDGKARYEITNAGTDDWNVQLKQVGLDMEKGASYKVNLKIGSSIDRDVKLVFQDTSNGVHGDAIISLKANKMKSVSRIVTLDTSFEGKLALQLSLGQTGSLVPHAIEISDISVTKVEAGTTADTETEKDTTITPPTASGSEANAKKDTETKTTPPASKSDDKVGDNSGDIVEDDDQNTDDPDDKSDDPADDEDSDSADQNKSGDKPEEKNAETSDDQSGSGSGDVSDAPDDSGKAQASEN